MEDKKKLVYKDQFFMNDDAWHEPTVFSATVEQAESGDTFWAQLVIVSSPGDGISYGFDISDRDGLNSAMEFYKTIYTHHKEFVDELECHSRINETEVK
jgi:hypothetical protein